jgi:hypothetical protein
MKRIVLAAGALLVAALFLTSAAIAQRPDDRGGMIGVGAVTASHVDVGRPDDRAGARGPGAVTDETRPLAPPDDRFDWGDAGVGAAGAFALALVSAALLALATHKQRAQRLA